MKKWLYAWVIFLFVLGAYGERPSTNCVDWTSAPSVLEYIDGLVGHFKKARLISDPVMTNNMVSANNLWVECLNFEIATNNYAEMAMFLRKRYEMLNFIASLSSFSHKAPAVRMASRTMLDKIRPVKATGRGEPVARPPSRNPWPIIEVLPEHTPEMIMQITEENCVTSNRYEKWKQDYNNDVAKKDFFKALQSISAKLELFSRLGE